MDDLDRRIVRALQDGLPIVPEPYGEAARQLGLSTEDLLSRLRAMLERGEIRRVGASLAHRKAGIEANAMVAWQLPSDQVERFAAEAVQFREITHCYERATAPDWPYNVYTMIHGRSEADCDTVIRALAERTGQSDYVALLSIREFKKTWTRL